MSGFLGAVSFLTRVPVRSRDAKIARSVPWFPLVGAAIGLALAGVYAGLVVVLPPLVAAALTISAGLLLTGAFHEDGLADVADAFGGGVDREETIRILKDPRLGTFGVLALIASIVVRTAALSDLDAWTALAALPAAHALSRAASVGAMPFFEPIGEGLGASYARELTSGRAVVGIVGGVLVCAVALGWWAVPAVAFAAVTVVALGVLSRRKIGGISGDVLGAIQQVVEIGVLVLVTAVRLPWQPV